MQGVHMVTFIFDLLGNIPNAALIYAQTRLLPMKHKWWFALIEAVLAVSGMVFKRTIGTPGSPVSLIIILLNIFVVPPLFYDRKIPLARRLVACAVALGLLWFGEMACGLILVACGLQYGVDDNVAEAIPLYLFVELLFAAIILIGHKPLRGLLARWNKTYGTSPMSESDAKRELIFSAVPIFQVFFMWGMLLLLMDASDKEGQLPLLLVSVALLLLCLVVDASLIVVARRWKRTLERQAEAEALSHQLDEELRMYSDLKRQLEKTAHARHDMNNHLQVLAILAKQGEPDRAVEYGKQVLAKLDAIEAMDAEKGAVQ